MMGLFALQIQLPRNLAMTQLNFEACDHNYIYTHIDTVCSGSVLSTPDLDHVRRLVQARYFRSFPSHLLCPRVKPELKKPVLQYDSLGWVRAVQLSSMLVQLFLPSSPSNLEHDIQTQAEVCNRVMFVH